MRGVPDATTSAHSLRDYALVADGERGAVLAPDGNVVWLCSPRWESDAVLAGLLDGGGVYQVRPTGRAIWGGRYEQGSLIWRNRWMGEGQTVETREALALPADPNAVTLLRRVEAVDGDVDLDVLFCLRGDYGRRAWRDVTRDEEGTWHGRLHGGLKVRWQGAGDAELIDGMLRLRLSVPSGGRHDLVLEVGTELPEHPLRAEIAWAATESTWQRRVPSLGNSIAPRDAQHAYAVLCGLTSSGNGMVAAATTSLPENIGGQRDYDYRYTWIRDQCYAGIADAAAGGTSLLEPAVRFVTARVLEDGPKLRPMYTSYGGPIPEETDLGLPGYPGGRAMVGNRAQRQFQLDSFGDVLLLLAAADRAGILTSDGRRAANVAMSAIGDRWNDADAGVWEIGPRWWTHSRLTAVAGLRAMARQHAPAEAARYLALADSIAAETAARALHPDGYWRQHPDTDQTDAALLLPPVRGAIAADDPRTLATLHRVTDTLVIDGYLFRFSHDNRPLGESEGAFLLCGFMLALAYHQQGDRVSAFRWFERNRAAAGSPGLFAEEFDTDQRQLRGNLPQAFVHALMLEAAVTLD